MSNVQEALDALDEWREPCHGLRIAIEGWHPLCRVENQFIERPRSVRMVWQYLKRVGLVAVWRKIRSRLAESARNRKASAVGSGVVLEAPGGAAWRPGDRVVFFAPNHPDGRQRVCVDERFVVSAAQLGAVQDETTESVEMPPELVAYVGWSIFSGVEVDRQQVSRGLQRLAGLPVLNQGETGARMLSDAPVVERIGESRRQGGADRPSAVLFGLGNYAKTQIVPHIRRQLDLSCVHEVDPDQLRAAAGWGSVALDTSPDLREGERYDAWFIAGYHHMHAMLAVQALRDQAYAVVEKPLATTWQQYGALRAAAESAVERRLFACFHKRYSRLNGWAAMDLGVAPGEPVDMHCLVYEIPLPRLHWYNWPNSGSRLVSNGCHWLDYFLFMNDYCQVDEAGLWPARSSDLAAFVRLENGATLMMSLTDTGSARLGVRDLIELRASDVTVRMTDAAVYEAENTARVLRRRRINPMDAYRRMYSAICRRISEGGHGDDLKTLRSTELMLCLEDELQAKRSGCSNASRHNAAH